MNIYPLIRPLLFSLSAESAHHAALTGLRAQSLLKSKKSAPPIKQPVTVAGIKFNNPIGLAAGLDKNADYLDALGTLGFGFIEVGTVTPKPQLGNVKPRMFRVQQHRAIINRLGFNNKGLEYLVQNVQRRRYAGVLGVNIGKNKDTSEADAANDYLTCLKAVYPYADYITANVSSPNTEGLRALQHGDLLRDLVSALQSEQRRLAEQHDKRVPLFIKIAPDLSDTEVQQMADIFNELKIDGLIATNTTLARDKISEHQYADEAGGLSGAPLFEKANDRLSLFRQQLDQSIVMIGVGGITKPQDTVEKFKHGADLVQMYSGLIYRGPQLVLDSLDYL